MTREKPHTNTWDHWQLHCENGRQRWLYRGSDPNESLPSNGLDANNAELEELDKAFIFDKSNNPNSSDRVYRRQALEVNADEKPLCSDPSADTVDRAITQGLDFYRRLQYKDGHWPGDYGGPLFLLPGLIIASFVTETPFPPPHRTMMRRYMLNHQNPDGGWGLHIEGPSTMFGTVMQYVALRILGDGADTPELSRARAWVHNHGGAENIPPWGKFYLSLIGVYEWDGCDSLFPELWLLPKWLPIHPWRYWCHARMVYLPMGYCYGHRITREVDEFAIKLRGELYEQSYESINWKKARKKIAQTDLYNPPSGIYKLFAGIMNSVERAVPRWLRIKALGFIEEYVHAEDMQTKYVDIGPVNQVINSIVVWHAHGKDSKAFQSHMERWYDYLWVAEDGMKMSGYNGSQLWDTAFAVQAIVACKGGGKLNQTLRRAYQYIDNSQVRTEVEDRRKFFRHPSVGGWPFSTIDHGWPISDCTAEAVSAVLAMEAAGLHLKETEKINQVRLEQAIDLILSFQNKNGGWATYENTRGPAWLEKLNPSGIYGEIMIDYAWTECTSACMRALCSYHDRHPDYRARDIRKAVKRGVKFLLKRQEPDGGWMGAWAVCYTYGTWFGIEGLHAAFCSGLIRKPDRVKEALKKASDFLKSKQNPDGGWGESYLSCVNRRYENLEESQVVQTAWALLGLMSAPNPSRPSLIKGIKFLTDMQQESGDWPQQRISGVFNHNCMITYTAYRNVFPLWALGAFREYRGEVGSGGVTG